jgi:hypothetical protein
MKMRFFLTAKHWQIFLLFLIGSIAVNFTFVDHPTLTLIIRVTGLLISFSWVLFVSNGLYDYLPRTVQFNFNLFMVNIFVCLAGYSVILILFDGEEVRATGLAALPMIYLIYALLHISTFPIRLLKSIELGEKARLGEYIGTFFLLVFWPIGIWFLQPRINKIASER